jgi:AcrR family transcriptional regulator
MQPESPVTAVPDVGRRSVGRPRQFDDDVERERIVVAAYGALKQHGHDLTVAHILATAGVSTRSFYRHFASKDALLCAMYRRDAEYAAALLTKRVAAADTPLTAVKVWVDEIFGFLRSARRAERVSVLGSIPASRAEGADTEATYARALLVAPLRAAIQVGIESGTFVSLDATTVSDLLAVAVLSASGIAGAGTQSASDQAEVTRFCLRALGAPIPPECYESGGA